MAVYVEVKYGGRWTFPITGVYCYLKEKKRERNEDWRMTYVRQMISQCWNEANLTHWCITSAVIFPDSGPDGNPFACFTILFTYAHGERQCVTEAHTKSYIRYQAFKIHQHGLNITSLLANCSLKRWVWFVCIMIGTCITLATEIT